MVEYRNSTQIVADLLFFTQESGQQGIRVTPLIVKSNLSYSRMSNFLKNLTGSGLINKIEYDGKNVFVITEKGRTYLGEYKKFTSLAGSFGLEL
jgi:predicted transcriptional regulator